MLHHIRSSSDGNEGKSMSSSEVRIAEYLICDIFQCVRFNVYQFLLYCSIGISHGKIFPAVLGSSLLLVPTYTAGHSWKHMSGRGRVRTAAPAVMHLFPEREAEIEYRPGVKHPMKKTYQ